MSLLRAAGSSVTTVLASVTTLATATNKSFMAIDYSAELLRSNAEVWAQRGIEANKYALSDIATEAETAYHQRSIQRAIDHQEWLKADPRRKAAWDALQAAKAQATP